MPDNLPAPLSSFVGREIETVEVGRDLSMTRLLTLTGAGGSGKTRLALEVASGLACLYPDGAWLVELAPLSDPELVEGLAQALGVREQPGKPLVAHLRSRHTLLVIDNCEHVVEEAASLVNHLFKDCPRLRVLATSREPLGVQGESVRPVPPLAMPAEVEEGEPTVEGLMLSEAVRLFVDRARSRLPDFEVTQDNAPSVARSRVLRHRISRTARSRPRSGSPSTPRPTTCARSSKARAALQDPDHPLEPEVMTREDVMRRVGMATAAITGAMEKSLPSSDVGRIAPQRPEIIPKILQK